MAQIPSTYHDRLNIIGQNAQGKLERESAAIGSQDAQINDLTAKRAKNLTDKEQAELAMLRKTQVSQLFPIVEALPEGHAALPGLMTVIEQLTSEGEAAAQAADDA